MNLIGKTLGQYQIVEQIGQSDVTTVFKAHQSALERHVAGDDRFCAVPEFVS